MKARIVVLALAVTLAACSQVLGLGDLTDRDPGASTDGTEPPDGGQSPNGAKPCVFDQSHLDDGCVFGP